MLPKIKMNKKALSEIVGYTILIVIAISLSVLVYSFLRAYIPKSQVSCDEDVKLTISDYNCSKGILNLTIKNKGLFKIDMVYIRLQENGKSKKQLINEKNPLIDLNPGAIYNHIYPLGNYGFATTPNNYTLEMQPAIVRDRTPIACENAIITQDIKCG